MVGLVSDFWFMGAAPAQRRPQDVGVLYVPPLRTRDIVGHIQRVKGDKRPTGTPIIGRAERIYGGLSSRPRLLAYPMSSSLRPSRPLSLVLPLPPCKHPAPAFRLFSLCYHVLGGKSTENRNFPRRELFAAALKQT